jgi:hypothetical protein
MYGYFNYLKSIFAVKRSTGIHMLNAGWEFAPEQKLVGFGYFQDQAGAIAAAGFSGTAPTDTSNRIVGLRLDGAAPLGSGPKLLYTAEIANQKDYADGDSRIDARYWHAGAGLKWKLVYARFDHEVLGSNDGLYAFQTPLGTNHLFQGWADLFLTTPPQGIRDSFVTLGGGLGQMSWMARAHDFRSDVGNIRYGKEFDLSVSYPLRTNLVGKLEFAKFREDDVLAGAARKPDTEKIWVTLVYNYQ